MAVKIKFDGTYNVIKPTFVLAKRNGHKIGSIPSYGVSFKDNMNEYSEISFSTNKIDCNLESDIWNQIMDFKLLWVREWDKWFEIYVETDISTNTIKHVTAKSLGESELSQINLYNIKINTEDDILRDDYIPTVFFNQSNPNASLLHKIMSKAPHYTIGHVDTSLNNIQRTFEFDKKSIYEAFKEVSEEIKCLFVINCHSNSDGEIVREINVYDLESYCLDCGERGDFNEVCDKCGIGYKEDLARLKELGYDTSHTVFGNIDTDNRKILEWNSNNLNKYSEAMKSWNMDVDELRDSYSTILGMSSEYDGVEIAFSPILQADNGAELLSKPVVDEYINGLISQLGENWVNEDLLNLDLVGMNLNNKRIKCLIADIGETAINVGEAMHYVGKDGSIALSLSEAHIKHGYGEDTTIFISTENLANEIKYSTDNGSVKNCFKLEAGDDLMTATIANCNPNGSEYIWYISDETKKDMSEELVQKIDLYNSTYDYYQNKYRSQIPVQLISSYNNLIDKYSVYSSNYSKVLLPIIGYPSIMECCYNVIDFYLYLNNGLMPNIEIGNTTALLQINNLNKINLNNISVKDIDNCSSATADSAVLSIAKTVIDSRYKLRVLNSTFEDNIWSGKFVITSYSNEEDTATSDTITCVISDNYKIYVKQKIDKTLKNTVSNEPIDIIQIFDLTLENFKNEMCKYSLSQLNYFLNSCQSCIDILIEQGISDNKTWANKTPNLYNELYMSYRNKLSAIEDEIKIRKSEIEIITGSYDKNGELKSKGIQTALEEEKCQIQNELNFEKYLGNDLWLEFICYKREDVYSNNNYISDGLDNSELFKTALEFIKTAKKDIFKSATLQHHISATLKNLLVMKEFEPIVNYFEIGNWIRIKADNKIYRLRILNYEIDFDDLKNISITFSDVTTLSDGLSDVKSILNQASNMATTYNSISRQATKGNKGKNQIDDWVDRGLSLTNMKIINDADNQNILLDNHGMLCKEYLPLTDKYDDKQLKIINRGLYVTDNGWITSKAGIGDFVFWNPATKQTEESYGVIADTLVGNLILSKNVGIYNTLNSITLDEKGLEITTNNVSDEKNQMAFTVQKKETDEQGNEKITKIMYLDDDGNLVLNGSIRINSVSSNSSTLNDISDPNRYDDKINNKIGEVNSSLDQQHKDSVKYTDDSAKKTRDYVDKLRGDTDFRIREELYSGSGVYTFINKKYKDSVNYTKDMLNNYKSDIGQYMNFDENGLTLGARSSSFKTVIDNQRIAFMDGNNVAAYISNKQLHIPNAVVEDAMTIGKLFFSPREDGGVSIVWQNE